MKKVYILTDLFPYGIGEETFITRELEILRKEYEIVIISAASSEVAEQVELTSELDDDIKVFRFCWKEIGCFSFYKFFLLFWTKKICWMEVKEIIKTRQKIVLRIWKSMFFYAKAESLYRWIDNKKIIDQNEGIYYSYWYNDKVLAMVLHRDEYPELKIITRAHGYDLFEERIAGTQRQPFKKVIDCKIDRIIFISDYNRRYYLDRFMVQNSGKYSVHKIGSPEARRCQISHKDEKKFRIVSCSNIIKLKRVSLIVSALHYIKNIEVEWVHFGNGPEENAVRIYAEEYLKAQKNIHYIFKGHIPREEIYNFYESNYVHCFINVSETEGSPVSMQEALAFGIPIIGTDVGGVSEMIDGNGYLLSPNPTAKEIADRIEKMAGLDVTTYASMRRRSFQIWMEDYDQNKNAEKFLSFLLEI